ncbi:hypothetical protein CSUB01_04520 [Colletotrichum sublineola]|uniref:Uncharacterized protein n=1 Tax=Colletotrichum sublineola TaxID=1173701 RepID=A0A066WWL4_COLSU|nr:hypothetical protein CSUB01_04520 [Colletotrichum sublineola]
MFCNVSSTVHGVCLGGGASQTNLGVEAGVNFFFFNSGYAVFRLGNARFLSDEIVGTKSIDAQITQNDTGLFMAQYSFLRGGNTGSLHPAAHARNESFLLNVFSGRARENDAQAFAMLPIGTEPVAWNKE